VDKRDELRAYLKERSIGNEVYYPVPFHMQKCYADLGYREGDFPASECAARESLALPIYPELAEKMIAEVVDAVVDFAR
jgi:dTDP-4-amino-4,6-dideoxygalactose transaminase